MDPRETHSPFKQFKDRGITRSVKILSSVHLAPSAPNVWQVEWASTDRDQKTGVETQGYWISTLTAECQTRAVHLEDQYLNPIGFTVIQYTVNTKHATKESV
jgi:type IV secretion system protein VirB8